MAGSPRNSCIVSSCIAAAAALSCAAGLAGAAEPISSERSFDWSTDVLNSDFRSDVHELRGNVRVTQGTMSIEAESATASALRTDHSRWTFDRSVHIKTADADLRSSSASAAFVDGQIADARVQGSPAQFEQRGGSPDRQVRGRAGVIEYDFIKGIVKLTNQVWFSYGKDEFRGDMVIYNIRDERVQVNPGGESSGRVKGTIRPRSRAGQRSDSSAAPEATPPRIATESGA